jgi:hypothetical protein
MLFVVSDAAKSSSKSYVFTFTAVLLLTIATGRAQEIPKGVQYKPASVEINQKAKSSLEAAFNTGSDVTAINALSDDVISCGPLLWETLKGDAGKGLLDAHLTKIMIGTKPPLTMEGRGLRTAEEKLEFWKLFIEKVRKGNSLSVRKADRAEIEYYWATIPFDIAEPLFIADFGKQKVLFNFIVKEGEPKIFWMDIVGDLAALNSRAQSPAATDAPPVPVIVEDKNAPSGWKRYQFAYAGGDTLSVLMPTAPQEFSAKGQVATDIVVTMMSHAFSANTKTTGYTAFYAEGLSVPAERMTAEQRSAFYEALWGGITKGVVRAYEQSGIQVVVRVLGKKKIMVGEREGIEQEFTVGPLKGKARMILAGQYAYGAFVIAGVGSSPADDAAFLNSFLITKK